MNETPIKEFNIIIEKNINGCSSLSIDDITRLCEYYFSFYAFILHDNDNTREHFHIVGITLKRVRLKTLLNQISDFLNIDSNTITIDKLRVFNKSIRYLIHFDEGDDKYHYEYFNIITNDLTRVSLAFKTSLDYLTYDTLLQVCLDVDFDILQIMRAIGLDSYKKYRSVISDIITYNNQHLIK